MPKGSPGKKRRVNILIIYAVPRLSENHKPDMNIRASRK